ncbi:tyrosine-type recombinase/integrase, partial [Acidithiobacillus ferriphilus]
GLAPFTPHDLRRTAATHIGMLGFNRLVISKILNHVEGGVTAIYDRHSYDNEKREALEAWSKKLAGLVSERN